MLAAVQSASVVGVDAHPVLVEVDVARGLPAWSIVGLASNAVKEARERVSSALVNSGFEVPARRTTVLLSPADQVKTGTAFDLPIALAVLAASGQLDPACLDGLCVAGELGLDGTVRPIRGALSMARVARARRYRALVIPEANGGEAALADDAPLAVATSLRSFVEAVKRHRLTAPPPSAAAPATTDDTLDLSDVAGQEMAKRALEIAAAGAHNLLLEGPPGAGKTMLARRLPTILPPLTSEEHLEVVAIHSVGGIVPAGAIPSRMPPFRAPHHTISQAGLIGGGVSSHSSCEFPQGDVMLQKMVRISLPLGDAAEDRRTPPCGLGSRSATGSRRALDETRPPHGIRGGGRLSPRRTSRRMGGERNPQCRGASAGWCASVACRRGTIPRRCVAPRTERRAA